MHNRSLLTRSSEACPVMAVAMIAYAMLLCRSGVTAPLILGNGVRSRSNRNAFAVNQNSGSFRHHFGPAGRSIRRSHKNHRDQHQQDDERFQDKATVARGHGLAALYQMKVVMRRVEKHLNGVDLLYYNKSTPQLSAIERSNSR